MVSATPKSELTRQRLIEMGVREILANGVDRLGFTAVAKRANMTTGALYARYENADEFLVDVWNEACESHVVEAVKVLRDAMARPGDLEGALGVGAMLNSPPPGLSAGVAILSVVRRNDTLREVIEASLVGRMEPLLERHPQMSIVIAHAIGIVLLRAGTPDIEFDWTAVMGAVVMAASRATEQPLREETAHPVFPPIVFEDDIEEKLFNGVADVMAAAGYEKATVSRIARRSGINPAVIYARYADKYELMCRCVEILAMSSRTRTAIDQDEALENPVDAAYAAQSLRMTGSDSYQSIRRMRLETLMAAWHREDVGRTIEAAFEDALGQRVDEVAEKTGADKPTIRALLMQGRVLFYGQALLIEFGLMTADNAYFESFYNNLSAILHGARTNSRTTEV
jgi:AcrR family transcriptional regulator